MATYIELHELRTNDSLRQKVGVACVVAAQVRLAGTPSAEEAEWARNVITNPGNIANKVINLVLAANKDLTVAQITSATDAAIQTNVDAVVDGLVT